VRVPDGSGGQTAFDQLLVYRLDIERADCRQISGAERWPDISAQQAFVAAVAFLPQARFRGGLKPAIQVFVQCGLHTFHLAAEVALAQHLIKVGLGMSHRAADNPAVVAPLASFAVAAEKDAHQPSLPSATHDLPGFSRQTRLLPRNLAHHWHTGAGNACFDSMTWGEGGVRDNQSASHSQYTDPAIGMATSKAIRLSWLQPNFDVVCRRDACLERLSRIASDRGAVGCNFPSSDSWAPLRKIPKFAEKFDPTPDPFQEPESREDSQRHFGSKLECAGGAMRLAGSGPTSITLALGI